jgi:uncharacterized cupredoxin-like copper-binding protein
MIKVGGILALMATLVAPLSTALAQAPTAIAITLSKYAFAPSTLNLQAGATYQLHLTNSGSRDHNFSAPAFFAAARIAPDDQSKVQKGSVEVANGQSIDITVTAGPAGTFPVECTHFMHKSMGMHGSIIVQ